MKTQRKFIKLFESQLSCEKVALLLLMMICKAERDTASIWIQFTWSPYTTVCFIKCELFVQVIFFPCISVNILKQIWASKEYDYLADVQQLIK